MNKFFFIIILIFCLVFFSYRLLEVPRGITQDEAAFGYNASLISQTLRDENNRFLPVFVLSLEGRDWRQPLTQYFQVLTFKIFGSSLFNLKFTSVVVIAVSAALIFLLGQQFLNNKYGLAALLIFITTPIIMIHSHLALDNIMPLPFILLWLIGLLNYQKTKSLKFLILSGVSLGFSFYGHKSMRSAVPIWTILTVVFLMVNLSNWKKINFKNYFPIIIFLISIAPFYLVSPILDYKYAGAVYGSQAIGFSSFYDFFYFYISNFDPSFLFIKGDTIMHHSTGRHGMFLLAVLPLFFYGIYKGFKEKNHFLILIVLAFFVGPLLLGFIGSVHRASRIIFLVPLVSMVSAFGFWKIFEFKNKILKFGLMGFCLVFALNYFDFLNYYWFKYADDTYHIFYPTDSINAYKKLDEISKEKNIDPYISYSLTKLTGDKGAVENFARSLYFTSPRSFQSLDELPNKTAALTTEDSGIAKTETGVEGYYLYIRY